MKKLLIIAMLLVAVGLVVCFIRRTPDELLRIEILAVTNSGSRQITVAYYISNATDHSYFLTHAILPLPNATENSESTGAPDRSVRSMIIPHVRGEYVQSCVCNSNAAGQWLNTSLTLLPGSNIVDGTPAAGPANYRSGSSAIPKGREEYELSCASNSGPMHLEIFYKRCPTARETQLNRWSRNMRLPEIFRDRPWRVIRTGPLETQ